MAPNRLPRHKIRSASLRRLVDNLRKGALARAAQQMVNRLEDAAAALCPWIRSSSLGICQAGRASATA